jgi:hypothetical protein
MIASHARPSARAAVVVLWLETSHDPGPRFMLSRLPYDQLVCAAAAERVSRRTARESSRGRFAKLNPLCPLRAAVSVIRAGHEASQSLSALSVERASGSELPRRPRRALPWTYGTDRRSGQARRRMGAGASLPNLRAAQRQPHRRRRQRAGAFVPGRPAFGPTSLPSRTLGNARQGRRQAVRWPTFKEFAL